MKICLLSDTHGFIDDQILSHFDSCDEIWHAGDFGCDDMVKTLENNKPLRGVFGNIDSIALHSILPEDQVFTIESLKVYMTHIGGYPPNYTKTIREKLSRYKPGLFICGHSHILKVIPDNKNNLLHINPGAAGHHGFHFIRTMVRFEVKKGMIKNLEVIELGKRGR